MCDKCMYSRRKNVTRVCKIVYINAAAIVIVIGVRDSSGCGCCGGWWWCVDVIERFV